MTTYCIFEAYFMIKRLWNNCIDYSILSNTYHRREGCRRVEGGKNPDAMI